MNTALAFLVPAVGMVLMSFVATPDLEVICVVVLVVTFAFNGGTNAGHIQNIIGLAPNRSQSKASLGGVRNQTNPFCTGRALSTDSRTVSEI